MSIGHARTLPDILAGWTVGTAMRGEWGSALYLNVGFDPLPQHSDKGENQIDERQGGPTGRPHLRPAHQALRNLLELNAGEAAVRAG